MKNGTLKMIRKATFLIITAFLSACDVNLNTIKYEPEPASETALVFLRAGLIDLDFQKASSQFSPELGLTPEATKFVLSKVAKYGFPNEINMSHYKFDFGKNTVEIFGEAQGSALDFTFVASMHRAASGHYVLKDFTASPFKENWTAGLDKLSTPKRIYRDEQKQNLELQRYITREKVLYNLNEGGYVSFDNDSFKPAKAVYQRLYEDSWVIEIEYESNFEAVSSAELLSEADANFNKVFFKLANTAKVDSVILAAKQATTTKVYRILFTKKQDGSWVRASS